MRLQRPGITHGPAPWYLEGLGLECAGATFGWRKAGQEDPLVVATTLVRDDAVVLAIPMYACVRVLPADALLVWHADPQPSGGKTSRMMFALFDVIALEPIADLGGACRRMADGLSAVEATTPAMGRWDLPLSLGVGTHRIEPPPWLRGEDELLLLVDSRADPARDRAVRTIWRVAPSAGEIEVLPQDWFNEGDYDFDWQWITRVGRDGAGRLVGDGIRLSAFRLDASGRRVAKWLNRSPLDTDKPRRPRS